METFVLGISGSPRKDGNTDIVVKYALDEIKNQKEIDTKFIRVADFNIKPCAGCRGCMKAMRCVIEDDEFNQVFDDVMNATVLILGAPVYWNSPPGVMKNFIDRTHTFYACPDKFPHGKKVGIISVSAGGGFTSHENIMQSWIGYYGGNIIGKARIYSREKGEVNNKPEQLKKAKELADDLCRQL
ncbi:flavodoxin family protein [bacterium]|nr:flavodoxin family protein [bacterium]